MNFKLALLIGFYFFQSVIGQSAPHYYDRRFNRYYNMEDIDKIALENQLTRAEVMTSLDLIQSRIAVPDYSTTSTTSNYNRDLAEPIPVNSRMIPNQKSARLTSSTNQNQYQYQPVSLIEFT